jgi:alcohol dehydrogenase, propanol-preferring
MASLPKHQKAAVKQGQGQTATARVTEIPVSEPNEGQILVKINWSGICATDKSLIYDEWAALGPTARMRSAAEGIAGHEGAGTVAAVHPSVSHLWNVGDRAGIKWVTKICRTCEFCTNGRDEVHCKQQLNSGLSCPGTFQQYALTDAHYATRLPAGVSDEDAGPIMCGGVTAYVACKRAKCRVGRWVVILGAGGGLGHVC